MAETQAIIEQRTLQLANTLQSTLEIEKLIELFAAELAGLVPHAGLNYDYPEHGIAVSHGHSAQHSCDYRVVLLERQLGGITVWRDRPFTLQETDCVEALLCALVYPLRNALLYRHALETALKDPVTHLNNRAAMDSMLEREVELTQRHAHPLSLIMLDVDRFKDVNDNYGHIAGDFVLRSLAETFVECIRSSDIVFRYGGEEFVVILSNTDIDGATRLARRIRAAIEQTVFAYAGSDISMTVSAGVANLTSEDGIIDLLDKADQALYRAKQHGRNRVEPYAA